MTTTKALGRPDSYDRPHRFAVGDRLRVAARMGDYEITVTRLGRYGTAPVYFYFSERWGREMWCEDLKCSLITD